MKNVFCRIPCMLLLLGVLSCDRTPDPIDHSFDRGAMLTRVADLIILPAFQEMEASSDELSEKVKVFCEDPTTIQLEALRESWVNTATSWQAIQPFSAFGPAENSFGTLHEDLGTFPVDTQLTLQYIVAGDTSLANFDRDTRGLFAMEFLIFGDDAQVVEAFTGVGGDKHKAYLRAISVDILEHVASVSNAWPDFRQSWIDNDGTDAGSSVSTLFNHMVASFEVLKNAKVGLPAGKRPGQTAQEPQLVEAYFSGQSLPLAKANFEAVVRVWAGQSDNDENLPGFEEYLETVVGGPELVEATKVQIQAVRMAFDALQGRTLSEEARLGTAELDALHTELQKLTRYLKSDLSSLLGISITFDSGDGD